MTEALRPKSQLSTAARPESGNKPKQIFSRIKDSSSEGQEIIFVNEPKIMLEEAKAILGSRFIGPEQVSNAFGFEIDTRFVEKFPYTLEELRKLREDSMLVYFADEKKDGSPITMSEIVSILRGGNQNTKSQNTHEKGRGKSFLFRSKVINRVLRQGDDQQSEALPFRSGHFYDVERPRPGWRIISTEILPESLHQDSIGQTDAIVAYLRRSYNTHGNMPKGLEEAIEDYESKRDVLNTLLNSGREDTKSFRAPWQDASEIIQSLKIREMAMLTPVEAVYAGAVIKKETGREFIDNAFTFTNRATEEGTIVAVRNSGIRNWNEEYLGHPGDVIALNPKYKGPDMGVIFATGRLPLESSEPKVEAGNRLPITFSGYDSILHPVLAGNLEPFSRDEMRNTNESMTMRQFINKEDLEIDISYEDAKNEIDNLRQQKRWGEFLRANAVARALYPGKSNELRLSGEDEVWRHLQQEVSKRNPADYIKWLAFSNLYTWAMVCLAEEVTLSETGLDIKMDKSKKEEQKFPTIIKTEFKSESWEKARKIMGEDYLGEDELLQSFGGRLEDFGNVIGLLRQPFPFSERELEKHKELDGYVVLRPNQLPPENFITRGRSATFNEVLSRFDRKFKKDSDEIKDKVSEAYKIDSQSGLRLLRSEEQLLSNSIKLIYSIDNYVKYNFSKEDSAVKEIIPASVSLVSKTEVPKTYGVDYLDQLGVLSEYLKHEVYKETDIPELYASAIEDFDRDKSQIRELLDAKSNEGYRKLWKSKLDHLIRPSAEELIFDLLFYLDNNKEWLKSNWHGNMFGYSLTKSLSDKGDYVYLGFGWGSRFYFGTHAPTWKDEKTGASIQRSFRLSR